MRGKFDKLRVGFIPGLVLPFILMVVLVGTWFQGEMDVLEVFRRLFSMGKMSALLSLVGIPNIGFLFFFLSKEWYRAGRGVMLATILYGLAVFGLKLVV